MAKKVFPVALLFIGLLFPGNALRADTGASLSFAPASLTISNDDQFSVGVVVNAGEAVNAAQGTVTFPADVLRVVSISKTGSILKFWADEPTFSNANGTVVFGGGLPAPGFTGTNGLLFTITFRASGHGAATVNVTQGSVLANDGAGTNVLKGISQGVYSIGAGAPIAPITTPSAPPTEIASAVVSQAYPSSNLWYNRPTADFSWTMGSDVDGVAYELTQNPDSIPSQIYNPTDHFEYSLGSRSDGIWYFNLRLHVKGAWGAVLSKKIKVDRTPPEISGIQKTSKDPTDPRPSFSWSGDDQNSGIQEYRVQAGDSDWVSPIPANAKHITLPLQPPGRHTLVIQARDMAGNTSDVTATFTVDPIALPIITDYPHVISEAQSTGTASQAIIIKGWALQAASILLSLHNGSNVFNFTAPVGDDGSWQTSYSGVLPSGTWTLTARAVDVRGALSAETAPSLIKVNSFIGNTIRFLAAWGALVLVVILALTLIIATFLAAHARLKRYRLKLRNEILMAQTALIKDMERLQEDLNLERVAKIRNKISDDAKELVKDVQKEIDHLKKDL